MAAVLSLETLTPRHVAPRTGRTPHTTSAGVGARRTPSTRSSRRHRSAAVYRRRRFVAAAIGLGVVFAAGHAGAARGGTSLATAERPPQAVSPDIVTVVVEPGDTLWSIAQRLAPDTDTREVVDALVKARGTSQIVPGETLTWLADS
jgi:Tfp pilus assembly protein FimV